MRIKLDRTICDGFGRCAADAPETFALDEWGYVSLAYRGDVPPEYEDGVRRAICNCPANAIIELADEPAAPPALLRSGR